MGDLILNKITITPLNKFSLDTGDVLRGMRRSDVGFNGFQEVYFSIVHAGAIKAWKKHLLMTLNLVVPHGNVRFVFFDETFEVSREETIGIENNYSRITVPPGIWFGFRGLGCSDSLVMNLANIEHNPNEVERKCQTSVNFDWERS